MKRSIYFVAEASPPSPPSDASSNSSTTFSPSIVLVIGLVITMFSLTIMLLLCTRRCKRNGHSAAAAAIIFGDRAEEAAAATMLTRQDSGLERSIIEALPLFKFRDLQGSKEGLECAVCISRFDDGEVLRLLPTCKHAFHVDCVDTWLDRHSTCPLCRHRVEAEDVFLSEAAEAAVHVYVQRGGVVDEDISGSSRFGSFRRISGGIGCLGGGRSGDEGMISPAPPVSSRFAHRIIVSDILFQHRWSDFKPSDLVFLSSQMIETASGRFLSFTDRRPDEAKDEGIAGGGTGGKRCMSEITGVKRFHGGRNGEGDEEKWFSIARTTVQWMAGREKS